MKKSFKIAGVIALSIFATGCAKEDGVNTKESKYIELTLTSEATQFIDDSETKTYLNAEFGVNWKNGDEIAIGINSDVLRFENLNSDGETALFKGTIDVNKFNTANEELFIYPASAVADSKFTYSNPGVVLKWIEFKKDQILVANNFDPNANVAAAGFEITGNSTNIVFSNLCGLLALELKGECNIQKIIIDSEDGTRYLATQRSLVKNNTGNTQQFLLRPDSGDIKSTSITLTAPEGEAVDIREGVKFYACVHPTTNGTANSYVNGISCDSANMGAKAGQYKITIIDDNGSEKTKTVDLANNVLAGEIQVLGRFIVNF